MLRHSLLATAALGTALLAAAIPEATAQSGRDGTGSYGAVGSWYGQNRLADNLGSGEWQDAASLLRNADNALARGQNMLANELLERAETRLLSRSVLESRIGEPSVGGIAGTISQARQAVVKGDRAEARMHIRTAMDAISRGAVAWENNETAPMQGGSTIIVPGGSGGTTVIVR